MGRLRRCWMGESHFAMLHQKRDKVLVLAQQVVIQPREGQVRIWKNASGACGLCQSARLAVAPFS